MSVKRRGLRDERLKMNDEKKKMRVENLELRQMKGER